MSKSSEYILLFGPQDGKALKRLYPELATESVFRDLGNDDLLFCWYFKNQSSPIDPEMTDGLRAQAAAAKAFPNNPDKRKKFSALSFEDKIKAANKRMGEYNPEARAMAKRIVQNTLNNFLKMSNLSVDDFKSKDDKGNTTIDLQGWNQYISSSAKMSDVLPRLLKQVEEGFGVEMVKTESAGSFEGKRAINVFHEQSNTD